MSGGVDSSAAACLLNEAGHEVIGVTFRTWSNRSVDAEEVATQAAGVAAFLGIRHEILDLQTEFKTDIIDHFTAEYAGGRTPSPCVRCNRLVKFGHLWEQAQTLGAVHLATGHYVRTRTSGDGRRHLLRGSDPDKDQSYFLCMLSQMQLACALFPLGEWLKPAVCEYVRSRSIPATLRESQELCFVEDGGHARLMERLHPGLCRPGDVVDTKGKTLGQHNGIHRYTVGQRRGLPIAVGHPVYVVSMDAATNRLVVGRREELMRRRFQVEGIRWIGGKAPVKPFGSHVRIRYNHAASPAQVVPGPLHKATVQFEDPQFAITPGQAAVFYNGDEVLGGGWIG
jgi:tRNA-specific 2-thiouridylase